MKIPEAVVPSIIRSAREGAPVRSNLAVCSNLFPRCPGIEEPARDVAFRCRVRGSIALHNLVPPGLIDAMTGRRMIRQLDEADRVAAFAGTLASASFSLLAEQIAELNAFRCIYCTRSTVSVWFEGGKVWREFVTCMCQRATGQDLTR